MNIIICGAGKVGFSISKQLSTQGHSVTVIDQSSDGAPGGLGDIIYEGFGTMNSNGLSFTITYTWQNTTPITGGSGTCSATYSK